MFCARCSTEKAADAFYANDRTCKECRKAMVRANRAAKVDQYRAFDRVRANSPDRVSARAAYQQTEAGRASQQAARDRYQHKHPLRREANIAVGNALRDGRLVRWPCQICGERAEAHHPDYSNFLGVVWLCVDHHAQLHAEHREYQRQDNVTT